MKEMEKQIDMNARWENLGISNDFLFGKVMQDPGLCKGLLQRILPGMEIDRIEYPELQKGINPVLPGDAGPTDDRQRDVL